MHAKEILLKAVSCEKSGYILEALQLYGQGIGLLRDLIETIEFSAKKSIYIEHIEKYVKHVRLIQDKIQGLMVNSELVDQIHIEKHSRGKSYRTLFGKYLDTSVKEVLILEPCLSAQHQLANLISFLELLMRNCRKLKFVRVVTLRDGEFLTNQLNIFNRIKFDMKQEGIEFNHLFVNSLHERKIMLSNGVTIKMRLGLHIYKFRDSMLSLGLSDLDLRRCRQTNVDIWRTMPLAECYQ